MSVTAQYWKFFLTETSTDLCYYVDQFGNLQKGNITSGTDFALPQHPQGWEDIEILYARNPTYWGVNRSFSIPLKFVGVGARIIRRLFTLGRGTEQPITMIVCKFDERVGCFMPYYKAIVDLNQNINEVTNGVSVNLIEGGILQLLKGYENTIIELPCNGSIPENIKVLCNGIKFNDTFHYQILKTTSPYAGVQTLPCVFLSNDGNNIGVIHGDQQLDQPYANYQQKSSNFLFSSATPTTVKISGTISIKSDPDIPNTGVYMYLATSLSQPFGIGGTDHAVGLLNPQPGPTFFPVKSQFNLNGQRTFSFNASIDLAANENLFLFYFNNFVANPLQILGGSFDVSFTSKLADSRVWAIPLVDAWRLLGQRICTLASTTDYPFNFLFTSNLLEAKKNFVITSGDAIRASTNPNYYQYFNLATLNPQNPNNTDYNQFTTRGPVVKVSLSDIFGFINPACCAALGNQPDANGNDSIFLEDRAYVFNPSNITVSLPQVANLRITPDSDSIFNWLEIGTQKNDYDETSGKYEYNNTNYYQPPVKSIAKKLEIKSKSIRIDSYGFELTRYNTQGGKSSTFNQNDSSNWALNVNRNEQSKDYYRALYASSIQNTASSSNTNILYLKGLNYQPVTMGTLDGDYFINGNDFSIFMFNQPSPGTMDAVVNFACLLNGLAGDGATIKMYVNGSVVQTWSQNITSVNTPFNGSFTLNRTWALGDNIYFTIDTIRTCTTQINSFTLDVGGGYFICTTAGSQNIQAGSTQQLIALPIITANTLTIDGNVIQVVSYGFQYFRFLSNVYNTTFDWFVNMSAFLKGGAAETMTFNLWKNGVKIGEVVYNGPGGTSQITINAPGDAQFSGTDDLNNYDMYWLTVSVTNIQAWIYFVEITFESPFIIVHPLTRKTYSNVRGIPNPESAFNIEEFTPARWVRSNGRYLRSSLYMVGQGSLVFQTADRNQFLSTTLDEVTITENANIDLHDLGDPYYYPLFFEFDTYIPAHAKEIFDAAANGYVEFIWKGKKYYGFPIEIKIKPALRESQTWKLQVAATNNLADLVDMDWDGITPLQNMDTYMPAINPLHFIPMDLQTDPRYNNEGMMDEYLFVDRVKDYVAKQNYFAKWQTNDILELQCQSAGLAPATITVLNRYGQPIGLSYDCDQLDSPGLPMNQTCWHKTINLSDLPSEGKYFFKWEIGTGAGTDRWISEGIQVKTYWPKTMLLEFNNSLNRLNYIFNPTNATIKPSIRVSAQINQFKPKASFATYANEPQDLTMMNAIPYDTWTLQIGFGSGEPDYMLRKIDRMMYLDDTQWNGTGYSRDSDNQMDVTYIEGQPKGFGKLVIRRAKNSDGVIMNSSGQIEGPQQAGYVLNAQAFGKNNNNQNLIQVQ